MKIFIGFFKIIFLCLHGATSVQDIAPSFVFSDFIFFKKNYTLALFLRDIGYVTVNQFSGPNFGVWNCDFYNCDNIRKHK